MEIAYEASKTPRKGICVVKNDNIEHLLKDVTIAFEALEVNDPLFHAVKIAENDEIEVAQHPNLVNTVDKFKETINDPVFGNERCGYPALQRPWTCNGRHVARIGGGQQDVFAYVYVRHLEKLARSGQGEAAPCGCAHRHPYRRGCECRQGAGRRVERHQHHSQSLFERRGPQ